jgi:hypothetical protein
MAVAAVIVLILYPIVLLAVGRPIFRWVSAPGLVTGLAVGMTTMAIVQGARVKARVQDAVRQCLGRRLCPSCGYDLAGLEAGADGCTVCPECGAAWRLAQSPSGAE